MTSANNGGNRPDDTPSDESEGAGSAVTGAALDALSSLLDRFGDAASPPADHTERSAAIVLPETVSTGADGAHPDDDHDDHDDHGARIGAPGADDHGGDDESPDGALPDDSDPLDGVVGTEALPGSADTEATETPADRLDLAPTSACITERDDTAEFASATDDTPTGAAPTPASVTTDETATAEPAVPVSEQPADEQPADEQPADENVAVTPTLPARDATPSVAPATRRGSSRRKQTRWDRPAPPRDWRFVVGGLGRILIVVGLLMFGFVAYQLWGTGLETARAQSRLENQFEAALGAPASTEAPDPTSVLDSTTTSTTTPASTTVPSPVTTLEPRTSTPVAAADQQIPSILPGQAIAKLEIPRIDKAGDGALYVLPGVDYKTLHDGPGHYPDTPLPGQLGNAAIAGHRSTSGAPFADVDQLADGDEIVVTMLTGDRFVYEVTDVFIVEPSDYWVVGTTDPNVAKLTLTSCHPRFSARQRIVVQASLRAEESAAPGLPTYYDLGPSDSTSADSTIDAGVDAAPATTVVDGTVVTLPEESGSDESGVADGSGSVVSGPDALTAGWFHDSAAWPHIAAWAAACSLIAFAAARLSRRFRSYPRGWAIAIVPFAVSLYFVYQNVNRLLPPGI